MTITELLQDQPDGNIYWVEGPALNGDGDMYENCRMNLDQLGCIHVEYQSPDKEWHEWQDCPSGIRQDSDMLNAIIAAALVRKPNEDKPKWTLKCKFGNSDCKQIGCDCYKRDR